LYSEERGEEKMSNLMLMIIVVVAVAIASWILVRHIRNRQARKEERENRKRVRLLAKQGKIGDYLFDFLATRWERASPTDWAIRRDDGENLYTITIFPPPEEVIESPLDVKVGLFLPPRRQIRITRNGETMEFSVKNGEAYIKNVIVSRVFPFKA